MTQHIEPADDDRWDGRILCHGGSVGVRIADGESKQSVARDICIKRIGSLNPWKHELLDACEDHPAVLDYEFEGYDLA